MKKVLIAYVSRTGKTEKMAEYIAEGVRVTGNEVVLKKVSEIKNDKDLEGFDAYVFGSPTYHRDMTDSMKTFLFLAHKANLEGKTGGAFGSYVHSGDAPKLIFDTMDHVLKMDMVDLGSFNLKEHFVESGEGLGSCQDYGRAVGQKVSS